MIGPGGTRHWHTLPLEEVLRDLEVSPDRGLEGEEALSRLERFGPNRIREETPVRPLALFLDQFRDFMIYVLLVAALISGVVLREYLDAGVILFIVVANGILGFVQEYRAERALESLRKLSAPTVRVLRGGREETIPSRELVPGDVVLLEAGDRVSADARLVECHALRCDESSLTGESTAVDKSTDPLPGPDLAVGDRVNMVFAGTHIVHGRGRAVVTDTGPRTELGKIAEMIGEAEEEKTPLQKELARTGKRIALLCLGICAVIFVVGVIRRLEWAEMFLFSVSLAVAAIPEGLPAIVTIALALGVRRMAEKNALLRRLPAVETLGCADVICTDKTGTLTRNEMEVREVRLPLAPPLIPGRSGEGDGGAPPGLEALVATSVLCNDARVQEGEFLGEGTEVALFKLAAACGLPPEEIVSAYPRLEEIPFESERKMMSTIHRLPGGMDSPFSFLETETVLLSKGAPEVILARCTHLFSREGVRPMSPEEKMALEGEAEDMARRALRTLAFACRPLDDLPAAGDLEELEEGLVYLGMAGMMDPPRPEAYAALEKCRRAHIEVVMITGDHAATAAAVAEELSILTPEKELVTGEELARMSDGELAERVESIAVYARVSPADKVKIVKAWKSKGKTVAMTGDGVNDAPALKNADIGVAMGIAGTDVSKEASDMVLADDNFATIVAAVEEGRVIYDNLKKFIYFLLSCNMSEVSTMFVGMLFAGITPLRAVQVLWMNLVTDGFPAMALGVDTPSPDVMYRPPRDPSEGILSPRKQFHVVWQGFVLSLGALASFFISYYVVFPGHPAMIQTTVFTTLVLSQLLHTYNSRSETLSFTEMPFLDNRALLAALGGSLFLQLAVVLLPPFMHVFGTEYIGAAGWGLVLSCSVLPVVLIDRIKVLTRRRRAA